MSADHLTTAIAANINAEVDVALADHIADSATELAARAWPPPVTPNAGQCRLSAMRKGLRLTTSNIAALAAALRIECDDLTSTNTDAARAALALLEGETTT